MKNKLWVLIKNKLWVLIKNKLWLIQIPMIIIFTFGFAVDYLGTQGRLENQYLRGKLYPGLRWISSVFTDTKFKLRGPISPKNKIVIVEVDSPSIETYGRWPWHRDIIAQIIDKTFASGAKVLGLDMVFSEPDRRVPDELKQILEKNQLGALAEPFETDSKLEAVIRAYSDRLVLGWISESTCQPLYAATQECPVANPDAIATHPPDFGRFSFAQFEAQGGFLPEKTPVMSFVTLIPNLPQYEAAATHQGSFNTFLDPDGYIRRTSLFIMGNGKPFPSLPLEMASVGLGEPLGLTLNSKQTVTSVYFAKSGKNIPVTPLGIMDINFRGPGHSFDYISVMDVLSDEDTIKDEVNRKLAGASKKELLKDAYVLLGVTAVGVFDMRAFPFDANVAGVEGHANILDNLLSGDSLLSNAMTSTSKLIFFLMIAGGLLFSFMTQKLEAIPALLLCAVSFVGFGIADMKILFENNYNWNTSFFYLEMLSIFIFTVAIKYVIEERSKKFVKGAFAKYVAPAVVDSIIKHPEKLSVGGEKRELTIMFSDIRSFTTFSEKMDAKSLAALLNDYLGIMTQIVFKNQGTLDKYIGDAIMAFWGAPLDQPTHAANCAKTAIEMMKALHENKKRFKEQYGVDVDIGVGLNSGVVNVGNMGSKDNFAYTVIGDHVNLASRMEGLTKNYGVSIVTSRFTFDCITASGQPLPRHRILDNVKVKGKKKAVELIQLLDREMSEDGLRIFEEGRKLYKQQKWDEAIAHFKEAGQLLAPSPDKTDGPSEMYIERCEEFKKAPPEPDWDGSWEMHTK